MPEVGERIKTEDGIGVVMDTNILENKIKVRLVVEDKRQDKGEKLSSDFYFYKKQQITRIDARDHKDVLDDIDEAILDEIKDLLKE